MFIKICGITNTDDAQAAVKAGASALGFIFASSPRKISVAKAARIISGLPATVEKIGVFVNAEKQAMFDIAEAAGLTCLQLHGEESPELCAELNRKMRVIKALKISPDGRLLTNGSYTIWKILLDTHLPQQAGGSGQTFDWSCLNQYDLDHCIVAGGLSPENLGDLLSRFQPFGIDINSGVEFAPGAKDHLKLVRLFQLVNSMNSHNDKLKEQE